MVILIHKNLLRTKSEPDRTQNEIDIDWSFLQRSYIEVNIYHSLEQKLQICINIELTILFILLESKMTLSKFNEMHILKGIEIGKENIL